MWDQMVLNGIDNNLIEFDQVLLILSFVLISLQICSFFFDVVFQIMISQNNKKSILPCLEVLNSFNIFLNIGIICYLDKMRSSNGKQREQNLPMRFIQLDACFISFMENYFWWTQGLTEKS